MSLIWPLKGARTVPGDAALPGQVDLVAHEDDGAVRARLHAQLAHRLHRVLVRRLVRHGEHHHVRVDRQVLPLHVGVLHGDGGIGKGWNCKGAFTLFTVFCCPALFAGVSFRLPQFFAVLDGL